MKNFKFRFLLPVMAFMLAIAAAFASQPDGLEESALVQGYILQNGVCTPHGTCTNQGGLICRDTSGRQVYGKIGTVCLDTLFMDWQP